MTFITDGSFGSTHPISLQLRSLYRIQSMSSSSPIDHVETLREIKEDPASTVFVVSHWENAKQFNALEVDFPLVETHVSKTRKGQNVLGIFDVEGRKFVVIMLKDGQNFDYVIGKLKKIKKIEKLNEFIDLDKI